MATTVTLDSAVVQAVQEATKEKSKASAVRKALQDYLRMRRLRSLAELAGKVDMLYTNEELEAKQEC
jgi:Arc/MetJ family transcription regulator